jgi:outer membrane protein TolC
MRIWALFVAAALIAGDAPLSSLKKEELRLERKKAETEASKLETSWINPINMSYTYQKGNQFPNQEFQNFVISLDQPIFKSLGIWEAIKYARAKRGESLSAVEQKRKELLSQVYLLAFTYKKELLLLQKQELALQNARIDVEVKREQYLSGELDGTFLDSAILKKNQLALSLIDLKQNLEDTKRELANLSDLSPEEIKLPHLKLVPKNEFLGKNLELRKEKKSRQAARHFKNMTISRYLPSLSLFYNYNYQKSLGSQFFPQFQYSDHYSTYGFRLSMPLFDINSFKEIESAKLDFLKSEVLLLDKRREQDNLFKNIKKRLELLRKKMELTKEDVKLYESLVEDTKARLEAGEKTLYDLKTMQNSLKQKRLDMKIFAIEEQILLLELYKRMSDAF